MADWKSDLGEFLHDLERVKARQRQSQDNNKAAADSAFDAYCSNVAIPAFEEIKTVLEKFGRQVTVRRSEFIASIEVHTNKQKLEMGYSITKNDGLIFIRKTFVDVKNGSSFSTVTGIDQATTKEALIESFVNDYKMEVGRP